MGKIKAQRDDIFLGLFIALLIITVAGGARFYALQRGKPEIRYEQRAFTAQTSNSDAAKAFVASKNGATFYPVGCKTASRIKPENRIYFATALEARGAGFNLSSAKCK